MIEVFWIVIEPSERNKDINAKVYHYPTLNDITEYQEWCIENLGLFHKGWMYNRKTFAFYFQDSEDALAFKLRFGIR
jgi:hypothetical protein